MFLLPNLMSLIHPLGWGVITAFKSYCFQTSAQLVKDIDSEDQVSLKDFWRNFNFKMTNNNIGDAWAEVMQSCMIGIWRKIWPGVITDFHDFEPEEVSSSRCAVVDVACSVGFEEVGEASVKEFL
jgi:hypothetical protein